jgi:predicted chitinase
MPLIPNNISDINFSQKDLFLDVKLETITINEGGLDFTGRPTFKVGFFRDSVGFGITNIKISTNASLQPTVDIEFKDLYGKTVFSESSQEGIDYKAIFQWPPPKFKFTFKGYLGQPVTWMLNMKTTSTQFNSDDGSYTIKATFIPNQWGMFADMPFLYLFAAKKLKADNSNISIGPNSSDADLKDFQEKTESIIDLMYVGKKIEVVKNKKTKTFEKTVSALTLLKRDPITGIIGGTFKVGDEISEITPENSETIIVDGESQFKRIKIVLPSDYNGLSEGEIKDRIRGLDSNSRLTENIRIKLAILKDLGEPEGKALKDFAVNEGNETIKNQKKEQSKKLDGIINKNLELIDELIKGKIYSENQEELKKLTIKEVFSRIAGDAAYILGYILDAGEQGYFNNQTARDEDEKKADIIGRYFPMKWKTESENSNNNEKINTQVPAKDEKYGIENFELKFVNQFIVAIAEGIAQNRALQAQNFNNDEDKIKHRVSNLEILSSNPFKNIIDWKEIASIIMKRAGVVGYLTQGSLVNAPGDYGNNISRNNNTTQIQKIAASDVVNLDDSILSKLQPEDLENLKEFCLFWMNLLDDTSGITYKGKKFGSKIQWKGGNSSADKSEINKLVVVTYKGNPNSVSDESSKSFLTTISSSEISDAQNSAIESVLNARVDKKTNTFRKDSTLLNAGFKAYTVEEYLEQFIGPRYIFFGRSTRQAINNETPTEPTIQSTASFYDTLSYITHFNNLTFTHHPEVKSDYYEFLVFEDAKDIQKLKEFQPGSNEGDNELVKSGANNNEDSAEQPSIEDEPQSILFFDDTQYVKDPTKPEKKTDTPQFEWYEELPTKADENSFISYNWCKSRSNLFSTVEKIIELEDVKDVKGKEIKQVQRYLKSGYEFKATLTNVGDADTQDDDSGLRTINVIKKPIAIIPYAQNWNSTTFIFFDSNKQCPTGGFFGESDLAISTRVFLREYCKNLYANIESLQDETSKIFGQILGKAGEHEDLMYQQMHNLFHQWQILALDDKNSRVNKLKNPKKLTPNVAKELEERFTKTKDTEDLTFTNSTKLDDGGDYSSGFIYSYPLQSRGKNNKFIKISDSLINIEPLYNAKANTTVLNVLQQLCSKNNFMFFPIAGNSGFLNIDNLFQPSFKIDSARISNSFQILFHPTPESRTLVGDNEPISNKFKEELEDFSVNAFPVSFGDPTNKIIKNVVVGTDDNKVTAESIVNLQRIVDNENKNRTVTTDCSLLSVFEGRSYKAKLTTLGNAQISPMQFFYLRNHAIFTGLYQIMKVDHSITPNNMTTDFEGIKMRYASGGYGGVLPITLEDYRKAASIIKDAPNENAIERGAVGQLIDTILSGIIPDDGSFEIVSNVTPDLQYFNTLNQVQKNNINLIIQEAVKSGINNPYSIAGMLAIVSKESSFIPKNENLYYNKERMPEVWSIFSKTGKIVPKGEGGKNYNSLAIQNEKNPEKLGDTVYGPTTNKGKEGGNNSVGDGFKYRGRGFNQLTFKGTYSKYANLINVDIVKNPDLLNEVKNAVKSLVQYNKNGIENLRKTGKLKEYNSQNINDFKNNTDSVLAFYHATAGSGKEVSYIKSLLIKDSLGGMTKALKRVDSLYSYVISVLPNLNV